MGSGGWAGKRDSMYELIAIMASLAALVGLLRLKVKLGRSMALTTVLLAVLLRVSPGAMWGRFTTEWAEKPWAQTTGYMFVTLTVLLTMVHVLGAALKETGVADRLLPALRGLFRSRRAAIAAIPFLMGMLPTPGGIMLSAPLVKEPGDRIGIDRARLAAINYFFRHQWESVWPLFPAVLLVAAIFEVGPVRLISHNLAIPLAGLLGGTILLLGRGIPERADEGVKPKRQLGRHVGAFLQAFWPIALTAVLFTVFQVPPAAGITVATGAFLVVHKVPGGRWWSMVKQAGEADTALLILGVVLFKLVLEAGDAVQEVSAFLVAAQVPAGVLVFGLPFLVAFLSGLTVPTAAISFPILVEFIGTGAEAKMGLEVLAFAGLLCGLLLTPVHLCLAMSMSYFEVPLGKVIGHLIGPVGFIAGAGVLMALLAG